MKTSFALSSGFNMKSSNCRHRSFPGGPMTKCTYLCGGIQNLSDAECKNWRAVAKEKLMGQVLDPMERDYRGREHHKDVCGEIVNQDLKDVLQSTAILVNASRPSWGTAMEIVYGYFFKKTVVAFTSGVRASPWLLYHSTKVVETMEEAIEEINSRHA